MTATTTIPASDRPGEPTAPVTTSSDADGGAGCRSDRIDDTAPADELWDVLLRARVDSSPTALAAAEDSVFRFYLPLTRGGVSSGVGAVDVERAAEVGLAEAVLRWPRGDSQGFEAYARVVIAAQLRRLSIGGRPHGRPTRAETSPVIAYASSSEANRNATRQRVVDGATGSVLTDLVG